MNREIENMERLMEKKGVQYRDFKLTSIEVREAAEGEPERLLIKGTPAVFDSETLLCSYKSWDGKDVRILEKVDSAAFDEADMTDVIFNYNHGGRVYARTRNNSLRLKVNKSNGLEMETELWDDDEGHKQLYRDIKRGNIDKMSYAYIPGKVARYEERDDDNNKLDIHYTIKSIKRVLDVSAVDIPAYDATEISARRMHEAESKVQEAESRRAVSLALAKYEYERERG